jgi:hypothetical protein
MPYSDSSATRRRRREFLAQCSAAAAAGLLLGGTAEAAEPSSPLLPTIQLGPYKVTRLIVGSNPLSGYSYLGPEMDKEMKSYFTPENTLALLRQCERAGINTHQFSPAAKATEVYQKLREEGSKLQLIGLYSKLEDVKPVAETLRPIAMVHHGGATDKRFKDGQSDRVHDFVKAVHDAGMLAGVSAHNPDCIQRIADEGWKVDFFMTCFQFLTRDQPPADPVAAEVLPGPAHHYTFYANDRLTMCRVIQQVKQPCLAFKILAGGRRCASQEVVREAFQFAYKNIKPTDSVIVGMYPRSFDQARANAQYARDLG